MATKKQLKILDFIEKYKTKKGYSPSFEEIRKYLKLKSVSTIHYHIKKLEEQGLLKKEENSPRSVDVLEKEKMLNIPLLGVIAAGQPIEAIENRESIAVPKSRIIGNGEFYALRVSGNSMIEENINNGDVVLVRKQEFAENGEKVVALIDNYEATLKKFFKENGKIRLQPANSKLKPIIIEPNRTVTIQGVVIDIIKNENDLQATEISTPQKIKRKKKLPLNKVILGDAVAELKKLPSESVDVIIIDPPYNIGKDFGNNKDKRELNEYIAWSKEWINESIRVMKPTGTMFIYGFSEILAYLSVEIPINKRWLIWHYTNKNVASLNFWQRSHESIICAWKDKPIFNRDDVREPYTDGFLNGAAGKKRKATAGRFSNGKKETVYKAHEGGALPRDVIKVPALAGGAGMTERWFLCKTCNDVFSPKELKNHREHDVVKHPTQKPLEITRKLIKSARPGKDGVVLIPFVGTGSECVVAKELEQKYIGFEINPDYIRIAEKWLSETQVKRTLF